MDIANDIADRFDLGAGAELTGPVARGHQAEVWRLRAEGGDWAVKRAFAPLREEDVRECAAFQEAASAAGVHTPRIRRTRTGDVLAPTLLGQVRVEEWIDIHEPDDSIDAGDVGAAVGRLHQAAFATSAVLDPWYHEPVGRERWSELVDELDAVGAPFAAALRGALDEWIELDSRVVTPSILQLCHRDLWADNVRRTHDGGVAIIDWHDSGPADPSGELATVLFEFASADGARAAALHEAYAAAGGPGRVERLEDFSMVIAQLGHILEIACRRWLTASASADVRVLNEARIGEFLAKPLDHRLIERLLGDVNG